jgi:hypothetical protein
MRATRPALLTLLGWITLKIFEKSKTVEPTLCTCLLTNSDVSTWEFLFCSLHLYSCSFKKRQVCSLNFFVERRREEEYTELTQIY